MPTLEEIGTRLQGQSIGVVGTDIFLGLAPDNVEADTLVTVLPTAGLESIRTMGVSDLVLRPSFQVMVLAQDFEAGRNKIEAVRKALHGFTGTLSDGVETAAYLEIKALQSEGVPIGRDDQDRFQFSCNFQVHKNPSVAV